jgi:hypothetical protein
MSTLSYTVEAATRGGGLSSARTRLKVALAGLAAGDDGVTDGNDVSEG